MRIDIMVDIETLGIDVDSTIIQVAAASFDMKTGRIIDTFQKIADITKNESPINVTGGTLQFWMNTDPTLLKTLLNDGELSSEDVLRELNEWILEQTEISRGTAERGDVYLWGNGILFDNRMIQHQMESIGIEYPIHFRKDRDVRTIVDLASTKLSILEYDLKQSLVRNDLHHHNAMDDVIYQIDLVSYCYNELIK